MRALLCAVLVLTVGCKKNTADTPTQDPPTDSALYSIKLADREAVGEKWAVTRDESITETSGTVIEKSGKSERYVQTVQAPNLTKLTRSYVFSTQERSDGTKKTQPYSNGVVVIEKNGDLYQFTLNGRRLAAAEAPELADEFAKDKTNAVADMLPNTAVRVGATWAVDRDAIRKMGRRTALDLDGEKSTVVGRLTRAYVSDGRQWGAVELTLDLALATQKGGPNRLTGTITREGPIDGTAGEEKVVFKMSSEWLETHPQKGAVRLAFEIVDVTTRAPTK